MNMKRTLLLAASLLLLAGTVSAQDWKDALKKAATAAADKITDGKLTQYALAGLKAGAGTFTFERDSDDFSATLGKHKLTGTYEYDAETHVVTLHFAKGKINLGSVPGHAYISGTELVLVFPVTRLVEMMTALGSRISSLSTAAALLSKYKDVYVGFAFSK